MSEQSLDLIVIGAGPGGYVAAIRAAQLGLNVAVVEKRGTLGGVCLNEGCIPSKALLDSSEYFALARDRFAGHGIVVDPPQLDLPKMLARKDDVVKKLTDGIAFLFKKNKITWIQGEARLAGRDAGIHQVAVAMADGEHIFKAPKVLIATGSTAVQIPFMPFDNEMVVSAREALAFEKVPKHLVVIGAGYIGLELGSVWRRLGAEVTVVEMLPKPLPTMDGQVADTLVRSLKKQGLKFMMETKVTGFEKKDGKAFLTVETGGQSQQIECDRVLVAVGRKPLLDGLGLAEAGLSIDASGRLSVNDQYETALAGIYAIGDVIAGPMLAHKASEEGVVFAERLQGEASVVEYEYLPGICYTWPEAASVGRSEEALKAEGVPYRVGKFSFMANGRARCMDETDGFVKIIGHEETGKVLGIHVIGPRASDLIAEAVTAMTFGATVEDIAMTFHAHPTLAEAIKEAALDVDKRAIHA